MLIVAKIRTQLPFKSIKWIVKINIPYIGYIYGMIQSMIAKIILAGLVLIYIIVNLVTKRSLTVTSVRRKLNEDI